MPRTKSVQKLQSPIKFQPLSEHFRVRKQSAALAKLELPGKEEIIVLKKEPSAKRTRRTQQLSIVSAFSPQKAPPSPPTPPPSSPPLLPPPPSESVKELEQSSFDGLARRVTRSVSRPHAPPPTATLDPLAHEDTPEEMGFALKVSRPNFVWEPLVVGPPVLLEYAREYSELLGETHLEEVLRERLRSSHSRGCVRSRVFKSPLYGSLGLKCGDERIVAGDPVCTYSGRLTTKSASDKLSKAERDCQVLLFDARQLPSDDDSKRGKSRDAKRPLVIVDGKHVGNAGRFANASHVPNCKLVVASMQGLATPYLVALRDLEPEEEITWNYNSADFFDRCLCAHKDCVRARREK